MELFQSGWKSSLLRLSVAMASSETLIPLGWVLVSRSQRMVSPVFVPGLCGRVDDGFGHGDAADAWGGAPVLGDVAEHARLDRVPLRGSWGIVAGLGGRAGLVGKPVQFKFPQPQPRTVRVTAIGGDHACFAAGQRSRPIFSSPRRAALTATS